MVKTPVMLSTSLRCSFTLMRKSQKWFRRYRVKREHLYVGETERPLGARAKNIVRKWIASQASNGRIGKHENGWLWKADQA